ncbi:mucin-1 [Leucoraja erinacea]|uniref:mucin-1 n=1 Tax=Leucoraja erinaceus TaxID=7782 RepID=UPI002454A65E|nr:mucin-1 [Leucoraja erinacea]
MDLAYQCDTCPLRGMYTGSAVRSFRSGSVIADVAANFNDSATNQNQVLDGFNDALVGGEIDGLRIDRVRVDLATPPTTAAPTEESFVVPGWGIALLVIACVVLLILLVAIILFLIYFCRRRTRKQFELFGSRGSYVPMADRNEYPHYTSHSRFTAPEAGKEQVSRNGKNTYSYTNHAAESDNL